MDFNKFSKSILNNAPNQSDVTTSKSPAVSGLQRIIYPAEVVDIEQKNGLGRIKAVIKTVDFEGRVRVGKDKNLAKKDWIVCMPLLPEFFHVRPQIGESVLVILENFGIGSENAPRYYIGPIRTTQVNMEFEDFVSANQMRNTNTYIPAKLNAADKKPNALLGTDADAQNVQRQVINILPGQGEVAIQGKKDSDLILGDKSAILRVARTQNVFDGTESLRRCDIELKYIRDVEQDKNRSSIFKRMFPDKKEQEPFTQTNIRANNINLIANEGKNKTVDEKDPEVKNAIANEKETLFKLNEEARNLHPMVLGDELIKLLSQIIIRLETHIHTPQKPSLENELSGELLDFTINPDNGNFRRLNELLSAHVRTN